MASLVEQSPEAEAWINATIAAHSGANIYGRITGSVVWSDLKGKDGKVILPFDPSDVVAKINERRLPLLRDHDPGRPIGHVLEAANFRTADGQAFVAAVLGFYDATLIVGFKRFGIDVSEVSDAPENLPPLPNDFRLVIEADPKEVSASAMADLTRDLNTPIQRQRRSHNSAEIAQQLVAVGVVFSVLVWNPFVKTFAEEAAKDTYKAARDALKTLIERAGKLQNPVVEIQATQQDCAISFIIRNKGIAKHYKANELLSDAALRAHRLVSNLNLAGLTPQRLVFEFDSESELWAPSFVELADGRLISDCLTLVASENLPMGLSLGLTVEGPD